jgi:hypothetical protein
LRFSLCFINTFGGIKPEMTIAEKIRKIIDSEALSENEKLDRLRTLIPADVFKIDSMKTANADRD